MPSICMIELLLKKLASMFQDEFPERQYSKEITHYENSCISMASNILKHIIFVATRSYKQ